MHILFFTDNFPPEVNAPASRTFEHCREWVKSGHQVTVITGVPNFPAGKVFDGYRNSLWQHEDMEGIRVIRVWSYIAANAGFAPRILDYASYMLSAVIAAPFVRRVDVVVGTSPQLFTACAAWLTGALKRVPYVFEVRDLWPESIRAVGAMENSRILDWLERLELFLYRRAALIISVTMAFRENLARRGIAREKVRIITNGVDLVRFRPTSKDAELVEELALEGKFVAGYIGTHGMAHALDTLLQAAAEMERRRETAFHFLFIGDGAQKLKLEEMANRLLLDNITFLPSVPKEQVVRYWSLLDASVIHLKKEPLFQSVIPSKMFEAMSMGIPILLGVEGEAASILDDAKSGLSFEPENAKALCDALISLREQSDSRARMTSCGLAAAKKYDRTRLAHEMLGLLAALVNERGARKARRHHVQME